MKFKLTFYSILFTFLSINLGFSQKDDIRFNVNAIDEITGIPVADCEFIVNIEPTGFVIPITNTKKESYYKVLPNVRFKVTALAKGYYKEEEFFESSDLIGDDILKLRLNPKKGNQAIIRVIDAISKKNIDANVEINEQGIQINESVNAKKNFVSINFDDSKNINIKVKAKDYQEFTKNIALNINGSVKENTFEVELTKNIVKTEVLFLDKDNNPISKVNYEWMKGNSKPEKGISVNNILNIETEPNAAINVSYNADGYLSGKTNFVASNGIKKIYLDKISGIEIAVLDSATGSKLLSKVEILKDNKRITVLENGQNAFVPKEIGNYSFTTNVNGYETEKQNVIINDLAKIPSNVTLRLNKIMAKYMLKVLDAQSKNPVNIAKIKVFDDKSFEHKGIQQNNELVLNLSPEQKYFYEVSADGYINATGNFDKEKNLNVYLEKIKEQILPKIFFALNSKTLEIIPARSFKLYDKNKKELNYKKDGEKYIVENYPENETIYYSVSVDGFKEQIGSRIPKMNNAIQFDPSELVNYSVAVTDTILNKAVDFTFEVKQANKNVAIDNKSFRMDKDLNEYSIKIDAVGYKTIAEKLLKENAVNTQFNYKVAKNFYEVTFNFDTTLVAENLEKSKVALVTKEDTYLHKIDMAINGFKARINPAVNYKFESILTGFENVLKDFTIKDVKMPEMVYIIHLVAKKPEVVAVVEKPKVEEPPKVVEKPAEKTPVVEPVAKVETPKAVERKVEEASDLPDDANAITNGKKYKLNGVNFERSKTVLVKGSEAQLKTLTEAMLKNKNLRIEIIGYTDNEDKDERLNLRLSYFRAKLVSNYLFNHGVAEQRIDAIGKGSANPVAPNDTEENKAKNRRVEIKIVEN